MSDENQNQTAGRSGLVGVFKLIAVIGVLLLALFGIGTWVGFITPEGLGGLALNLLLLLTIIAIAAALVGILIGRDKR